MNSFPDYKQLLEISESISSAITKKQDKLSGQPGQIVGFGESGAAQAVNSYANNENLLDNADFRRPVNQRGNVKYIVGYTIDRWLFGSGNGQSELIVTADGLEIRSAENSVYNNLETRLEKSRFSSGEYTLSFLVSDPSEVSQLYVSGVAAENISKYGAQEALCSLTFHVDANTLADTIVPGIQKRVTTNPLTVVAAKLEPGPFQTLAHKEGDTWVLNDPPPDKTLELLKCQRYYLKTQLSRQLCFISDLGGECIAWIPTKLPVAMRINSPAIVNFTINPWVSHSGAMYDTKGVGIKSVSITSDGSAEKDGNIGFLVAFAEGLQNYVNGSIGCIGYLNLELDANL